MLLPTLFNFLGWYLLKAGILISCQILKTLFEGGLAARDVFAERFWANFKDQLVRHM